MLNKIGIIGGGNIVRGAVEHDGFGYRYRRIRGLTQD